MEAGMTHIHHYSDKYPDDFDKGITFWHCEHAKFCVEVFMHHIIFSIHSFSSHVCLLSYRQDLHRTCNASMKCEKNPLTNISITCVNHLLWESCDREWKREFKIWAAEELLQVKILFEEISLKVTFEGREGRAVTESERKKIPDLCSREAGDVKSSITQKRMQT